MMNRISYDIPALVLPLENMPAWAGILAQSEYDNANRDYLHGPGGLDNFYDQANGWLETETIKRRNSPDPAAYVPEPFKMAIPRRRLVAFDEHGMLRKDVWADADPGIKLPELAPYVKPAEVVNSGIKMAGPPPDQMIIQMLTAALAQLNAMSQRLAAIEQRLGSMGK